MNSPSQQGLDAGLSLEEPKNTRPSTVHIPRSPRSSGVKNNVDLDCMDGFYNDMGLSANLPFNPREMQLSHLITDVAYSHSETSPSAPSPADELSLRTHLAPSHSASNKGVRNGDIHTNSYTKSHSQLPPHILDPIFDDLDFFRIIPYPESNEFTNATSTHELPVDKAYPYNNMGSQEIEVEMYSPQSRSDNLQMSKLSSQINGPESQGSVCSADHFSSPKKTGRNTTPSLVLNDRIRQLLLEDLEKHLSSGQSKTLKLPSTSLLQRFLSSYQSCFHQHYPILHLASLDLEQVPSPLILAICAIGALYRLERKHSASLQQWADKAIRSISNFNPSTYKSSPSPIWVVQCKFLLAFARAFSGIPAVVRTALESLEYLSMEYTIRRIDLEKTRNPVQALSWANWVEIETSKRLLCGIFVLNSLVTITHNTTPRINMLPDADIEMPHEEALWEASSSKQWLELVASRTKATSLRVIDAVNHVLFKQQIRSQDAALAWSTFATTIVIQAVNLHIYHLVQCTQAFALFDLDHVSQRMRAAAMQQAESALERCQNLFADRHLEQEQALDDPGGSRRSNGHALLRVAYVRTCGGMETLNRLILLSDTFEDTARDIHTYICSDQNRTALVTNTARKALDGLFTSVNAGKLLVMKTAAFKWSIDHAIADWNCALFVTRWIHKLECQQHSHPLDLEERQILEDVIDLLSSADISFDGSTSLAAKVIRLWADFFDDTWVWGITPRMGAVMRVMATVCESDRKAHRAPAY
ncbi:uncharacterized protein BP5553_00241 [Venustampulla echinocandica]|uniref:Xylanolytic transcriptional activator regulatory domain-containing protein n=1 Tax=Venustampulla echinocandica TaxID=2656787 RepID=A0A370TXL1_9HELO|nr:uncharacterized protein BP5553_00241 [Venustampulla echinocandica]RDL40262.1 hypothetical protein BP5553_00241 [Venustampulla echinocandica]